MSHNHATMAGPSWPDGFAIQSANVHVDELEAKSAAADIGSIVRTCGQEGVMIAFGVEGSTRIDTLSSKLREGGKFRLCYLGFHHRHRCR